jgi:hypothetical protein
MRDLIRVFAGAGGAFLLLVSMAEATICVVGESIRLRRVEGIVVVESAHSGKPDALLSGVTVELSSGQYHATTVTDADGYFKFSPVRQGNYQIRASLEGFRDAVGEVRVRNIGASAGRVLVLGLTLPLVGSCGGGVTTETFRDARLLQQELGEPGRLRRRRAEECKIALREAKRLPELETSTELRSGDEYYVDGLIYSEFEESGLIGLADFPESELEALKSEGFCYRSSSSCAEVLPRRFATVRIRAVVKYLGVEEWGARQLDVPPRCYRGSVEIVQVVSLWDVRK